MAAQIQHRAGAAGTIRISFGSSFSFSSPGSPLRVVRFRALAPLAPLFVVVEVEFNRLCVSCVVIFGFAIAATIGGQFGKTINITNPVLRIGTVFGCLTG